MPDAHQNLWITVLAEAVRTASKGRDPQWIGSEDYRNVCRLAGVDHSEPVVILNQIRNGRRDRFGYRSIGKGRGLQRAVA
jgi:hypothetical protein